MRVAGRERLNGAAPEEYVSLAKAENNNLRAMLQKVAEAKMLTA